MAFNILPMPDRGDEHLGLHETEKRYKIPYSTLRHYVDTGVIPAMRSKNGRVWLQVRDIEANLFTPVTPKTNNTQGVS